MEKIVNIHAAKTHLSRLVEEAANGSPFLIARAGKPLVRVIPIDMAGAPTARLGFMAGEIAIPDDFDTMGSDEISRMFGGDV